MKKIVVIMLVFFIGLLNIKADRVEVTFSSCVDGDTIKVNVDGKEETLRLLAIDTPETVHPTKAEEPYGKEASEYTCNMITNSKMIEIEYDSNSDKRDKYDRLLAWVYADNIMIQKELVSLGYAKVAYIYGDYKYTDELYDLEEEAANKKFGIWSEEEYSSQKKEKEEDKTLKEVIMEEIEKYIEKTIKDMLKKLKKELNKFIKSIFS